MIREVWETRHPDGGMPEHVTYAECDECGREAEYAYQIHHGAPCWCAEHALENGWSKCSSCGKIYHDIDLYIVGDELYYCDGCIPEEE